MKVRIKRTLLRVVQNITDSFPVILITGPRQVGKTTLLEMCTYQTAWKYSFVSLDDLEAKAIAQNDPNAFFKKYKPPLIIDEIQYAPQLLGQIKIIVDSSRKPGLFWLTGSQKFTLMKGIQESLAGRIAILSCYLFSR